MTTTNTPVIDPAVYGTTTWVHLNCVDCGDEWMHDEDEGTVLRWPTVTDAHRWLVNEAAASDGAVLLTDDGRMRCYPCNLKRECTAAGHEWSSRTTACNCRGDIHPDTVPCTFHPGQTCAFCGRTGARCAWVYRHCDRCGHVEDLNTRTT